MYHNSNILNDHSTFSIPFLFSFSSIFPLSPFSLFPSDLFTYYDTIMYHNSTKLDKPIQITDVHDKCSLSE